MDREDLRKICLDALSEKYGIKTKPNPAYSWKEERKAWAEDQEYTIPRYINRSLEEQYGDPCYVIEHSHEEDECGYYIRALSFEEVVNTIMLKINDMGLIVRE